jgi:hypothetical protein
VVVLLADFLDMFHVVTVDLDFLKRDGHPGEKGDADKADQKDEEKFHGLRVFWVE